MRTIKQFTIALLMVMLAVTSCKKDEQQSTDANSDAQMSRKTTKQLLAFRDQLKLKNGSSLPVDSATWYLEGLLNLENANNNHQFDGLTFYYDTLVMYTAGGSLSLAELNEAYAYFTNKLNALAQTQTIPEFAFNSVDITINTSGLKNGETELVIGAGWGSNTVGNYAAFGPTDYWKWGMGGGKCDSYTGQGGTSDAAQQLNYKFNHPVALPEPGYYTGVVSATAWGDEFPDINNPGPYCDYKIFWFEGTSNPCLSPTELNYYLSTFPDIIGAKRPDNKTFISVSVVAILVTGGQTKKCHWYGLEYGTFQQYN